MAVPQLTPDLQLQSKFEKLQKILRPLLRDGLCIAFSGGVDSAFLLWTAENERAGSGGKLLSLTTRSESLSEAERSDVEDFIGTHRIEHVWQESKEMLDPRYAVNDERRCYYCKTELFRICGDVARERGLQWIAYGYNASDGSDFRPGHQAADENAILSPLADAGLSKNDIRALMSRFGLEMADKPASPCLSSRLVTGVAITPKKLSDVEFLEGFLRSKGLRVFRVRLHEASGSRFLRLEADENEMETAFQIRKEFAALAKDRGFRWVTLDLDGYRTGGGNATRK